MSRLILSIAMILVFCGAASAQSTTVTWQGFLKIDNVPASGFYDMYFGVYEASTGGSPIAGTELDNTYIPDGFYTVGLILPVSAFVTDSPRYLGIEARVHGTGPWIRLAPRVEITRAPFAIQAMNSSTVGGFAPSGFIQNSSAPQTANFNLNGNGTVSGNLLVGTPLGPQAKLSVIAPTINAGPNTAMFAAPNLGGNTSYIHYGTNGDWYIRSAGFFGKVVLQDMAGASVGIGTATPGAKVHILDNTGNLLIGQAGCGGNHMGIGFGSSFTSCTNYSLLGNGTDTMINRPIGGVISFRSNNAEQMKLDAAGNLIVNGFTHLNSLSGGGTTQLCRNPANEVSLCGSSLRYKTNVTDFSGGLDLVRRLRPVTFMWKENHSIDLGLVAEDVARVEPLLTTTNAHGEVEGVKYDRISVVAINAIKEQQAEIDSLKSQVVSLDSLKQQVAALKALLCNRKKNADICRK